MAIARYDPASNKIDWLLGLGQDRTHMIVVSKDQKTIFTSNVSSNTISIIERSDRRRADRAGQVAQAAGRSAPGWAGWAATGRAAPVGLLQGGRTAA